jgi:hypothetical protein
MRLAKIGTLRGWPLQWSGSGLGQGQQAVAVDTDDEGAPEPGLLQDLLVAAVYPLL